MEFVFRFLAETNPGLSDTFDCELPIAHSKNKSRAVISHRYGKKSKTTFSKLNDLGKYTWWEARTDFYRIHQLRIHAKEMGLRIVGEHVYQKVPNIYLSSLKKHFKQKGTEAPIYPSICLYMSELNTPSFSVKYPLPKKLALLDKSLL